MGFSAPISVENTFKISNNRHIKTLLFEKITFRNLIIYIPSSHLSLFSLAFSLPAFS